MVWALLMTNHNIVSLKDDTSKLSFIRKKATAMIFALRGRRGKFSVRAVCPMV